MPIHVSDTGGTAVDAAAWRAALAAGEVMRGLWLASGSDTAAEILGGAGADWIIIDTEHSVGSPDGLLAQLRVLEAAPVFTVVRLGSRTPRELGYLLDLGARGLMVPMVESAEDARSIVAATRYPPGGVRGVGGGFARASRWNRVPDYLTNAESTFSLIAQVESVAGLENLTAITAVDGIDAVFVGPADLAGSMGLLGRPRDPRVRSAVLGAIETVRAAGKAAGVNAFDPDDAMAYAEAGAQLLGVGADVTLLAQGATALLERVTVPGRTSAGTT
ncbi:HpcH/HpaI aldolase/citrate lyase family protein [Streptomyces sp. NPDC090075]|uniref:HpcH/HpaI aldolase family protein n=1 Tax=Streptomyces sp. NPDC090075 TaxID=3365937 RepID=UPI0038288F13